MSLITAITTFLAGSIQALSGFGGGIIMMMIFPYFFAMDQAAALSGMLGLPLALSIAFKYRKSIQIKLVILPSLFFLLSSGISITISSWIDLDRFKIIFGILLVVLAVFFSFFSNRITIKQNLFTIFLCSTFSGIMGGFFGIGGPLLVIYFLSVSKTNKEYLGSVNFVFAMCEIYNLILRICTGIIRNNLIPYMILGCICILAGRIIGSHLSEKINGEMIKKIIYVMLAFSGIVTIFQSL